MDIKDFLAIALLLFPFAYYAFKMFVIYDTAKHGGAEVPQFDAIFVIPLFITAEIAAIMRLAWWAALLVAIALVILATGIMLLVAYIGSCRGNGSHT